MVTEALSSEETTVETAITAVSGLSSYFSAVVALAVEAAITAADVAAAADSIPIYKTVTNRKGIVPALFLPVECLFYFLFFIPISYLSLLLILSLILPVFCIIL